MLMRLVSNFATFGQDTSSRGAKKINKNISVEAIKLKDAKSPDEFHDLTINEHQLPLKDLWEWIIENKDVIDEDCVFSKFIEYPFVIITKEEDLRLNKNKKEKLTPELRYQKAGITIVRL
jgi:hypothetical protein